MEHMHHGIRKGQVFAAFFQELGGDRFINAALISSAKLIILHTRIGQYKYV